MSSKEPSVPTYSNILRFQQRAKQSSDSFKDNLPSARQPIGESPDCPDKGFIRSNSGSKEDIRSYSE